MQVSLETTEGLGRRMTVSVPAERVDAEVENRLKKLSRTVSIKGFRPGKVPMKVVESRYGSQVRQEVVDETTRRSFQEAVSQEKLQVIGSPRFQLRAALESGCNLEYEAVFDVLGKVELAPLGGARITRQVAEITEADVDNMVDNLRRQRGEWRDVSRAAAKDDRLIVDFVGRIDGEEFQGNRGLEVPLQIGAGHFIPGFEEGLIGVNAGETRVIEVDFPADYHVTEVAGKHAHFEIKVHSVAELVPAEIDEAFIRSFDIQDGTIASLRAELRETMQDEMNEAIRDNLKKQVLEVLYAEHSSIELPRSQVEMEIDSLAAQAREILRNQGVPDGTMQFQRSAFEDQAKRRVALGLLVLEIAKREKLVVSADRVRQRVEAIAAGYENPQEVMRWYYGDRSRLTNVEQNVIEDQVVDWVLTQVQVVDEPTDFPALLKQRQGRR
jgi:trigger factor